MIANFKAQEISVRPTKSNEQKLFLNNAYAWLHVYEYTKNCMRKSYITSHIKYLLKNSHVTNLLDQAEGLTNVQVVKERVSTSNP